MKRILLVFALILSLVICLPACGDKIEENPEFARFNEMFQASFDNYIITVSSTSASGYQLNNLYMITTVDGVRSVSYTVETLNEFNVEGDLIEIPESYKSVEQGTYDAEISASSTFDVPHFNFSYKCIKSDAITPKTFSADITSLAGFMGTSINATEAKFIVFYSDDVPSSIAISYVTEDDVTVLITYTFN